MTQGNKLERGIQAKHELTLVEERIDNFEQEIMHALTLLRPEQDQERRNFCQALQISKKVLRYLELTVSEAEHAKNKLDDIQKIGKKATILERVLPS